MSSPLSNQLALVTGAGKNLGREIALELANAGADVVIHVRDSKREGQAVVEEIKAKGRKSMLVVADLLEQKQIVTAFKHIRAEMARPVSLLINNAAIRPKQTLLKITASDWDNVLNTNLRAPLLCIQQVLEGMIQGGYGRIINISGADAITGLPNRAHNIAAKAGLLGLTKAVAHDVAVLAKDTHVSITCNAVLPGVMDTTRLHNHYPNWKSVKKQIDNYPIPRLGQRKEIAKMCVFLASQDAGYITGQTFVIDGGATIQPFFQA